MLFNLSYLQDSHSDYSKSLEILKYPIQKVNKHISNTASNPFTIHAVKHSKRQVFHLEYLISFKIKILGET